MNRALLFSTFYAVTSMNFAFAACTDRIDLTPKQIDQHFEKLQSTEASELEKIRSYNELCRSKQTAIRTLAEDVALAKGGNALRSTLLASFLLEREALILEPFDTGELSENQRDWIENNPPPLIKFIYKDSENTCIGILAEDCRRRYVLDYSGIGVSISYNGNVGELSLNDEGRLEGTWIPKDTALRIPVRARLR